MSTARYDRAMRWARTACVGILLTASPALALEQTTSGLWPLFRQSFDLFTVLLVLGSLVAVAVIVRCVLDIRPAKIMPASSLDRIDELTKAKRFRELESFVADDSSFVALVVRAALDHPSRTRVGMRDAAEMIASDESARWFRKIELLNVLGNLGPLIGLAGTVWGMILAFSALGATGGQANPGALSLGISKALFHTLLGLLLAIPCLAVFGAYRSVIDRLCTRGMVEAARVVELLPATDEPASANPTDTPEEA